MCFCESNDDDDELVESEGGMYRSDGFSGARSGLGVWIKTFLSVATKPPVSMLIGSITSSFVPGVFDSEVW